MTFPPEVWVGVLHRLQVELPPFSIEAWLEPLTVIVSEGGLRLLCPSSFHRDRVRDRFLPHILASLHAEMGEPVRVELALRSDSAKEAHGSESGATPARSDASEIKISPAARKHGTAEHPSQTAAGLEAELEAELVNSPEGKRAEVLALPKPAQRSPGPALSSLDPHGDRRTHSHRALGDPGSTGARAVLPAPRSSGGTKRDGEHNASHAQQRALPYTFDNFVVGPCNALAREASLAMVRERQLSLNQLYLTSKPGNGKTHLSRAAVVEARTLIGERALYTSAEGFTNEFLTSLRTNQTERFKRKYRKSCDVLVIEDIHFFEGKASTQLEFFHTVQHLLDAGRRVLLTGDGLPQSLVRLDARIRSQLSSGFIAELEPPDAQVRRNILRSKAAGGGVHLPDACLDLLVEEVQGSVRDLEGVLIQIVATASLLKHPIDIELTREAISKKVGTATPAKGERLDPTTVIRVVASFFKTTPEAMASRSRRRHQLVPRQLAMYLSRKYTDASLAEIGRLLARDHPAVRNAISKIERAILEKVPLRYQVESLCERLDELADGRR